MRPILDLKIPLINQLMGDILEILLNFLLVIIDTPQLFDSSKNIKPFSWGTKKFGVRIPFLPPQDSCMVMQWSHCQVQITKPFPNFQWC